MSAGDTCNCDPSGYESSAFRAHVYADVPARLRAWRDEGKRLYVYSSGSVQAQELFFRHSEAGDLHALFDGFFDTEMGAKRDAASYRRIAEAIGVAPGEILFLSDIAEDSMRRAPPACTQRYLRARRRSARSMETIVARPTSMA